jgi:hypothetical protein
VRTRIGESDRNAGPEIPARPPSEEREQMQALIRGLIGAGAEPELIAERVLEGIERRALYVVPNPDALWLGVRARFDAVLAAGPPRETSGA